MKSIASVIVLLLSASAASAEWNFDWNGGSRLRIGGFGTFGLATSDQNGSVLTRDIGDREGIGGGSLPLSADSRLGLQIDAIVDAQWSATVQAVLKDRPEQSIEESLQWAFVSYRPNSHWQLRVGRVGLDMGLVSDQRNVGYSYLWVRPPIEYYGRLPLFQFNGGDVSYAFDIDEVNLSLKTFVGEATPYYPSEPNYNLNISPLWGGNINLRWQDWHAQFSYVGTRIGTDHPGLKDLQTGLGQIADVYPQADDLAESYRLKGSHNHFLSAGIAYEGDPWRAQAEFGRLFHGNGFVTDVYMAYATVAYRIGPVTPFIGYSSIWPAEKRPEVAPSDLPVEQIQRLLAAATQTFDQSHTDQETVSFGGRWDFYNNMALKLQYDLVHVRNPNSAGLWRGRDGSSANPDEFSSLFSATLDFVF